MSFCVDYSEVYYDCCRLCGIIRSIIVRHNFSHNLHHNLPHDLWVNWPHNMPYPLATDLVWLDKTN